MWSLIKGGVGGNGMEQWIILVEETISACGIYIDHSGGEMWSMWKSSRRYGVWSESCKVE